MISSILPCTFLAGVNADTDAVEKLYLEHSDCKECPVYKDGSDNGQHGQVTASTVSLATKVTFMNEMYDVLKAARGADWKHFHEHHCKRSTYWKFAHEGAPAMTDSVDTQVVASQGTPPHWRGSQGRY